MALWPGASSRVLPGVGHGGGSCGRDVAVKTSTTGQDCTRRVFGGRRSTDFTVAQPGLAFSARLALGPMDGKGTGGAHESQPSGEDVQELFCIVPVAGGNYSACLYSELSDLCHRYELAL
jgi:hypothetical protein